MKEDWTEFNELAEMLHYIDMRSVRSWCHRNNIMVLDMGNASYVPTVMLKQYYEQQFKDFVARNFDNSDQVMEAHNNDDKVGLSESMGMPINRKIKKKYTAKKAERSKAAQEFLNSINKSA